MTDDSVFPVIEIFGPTIQGEGAVCGMQTHFIRFGGCDYKCTMCDSMHAVDKNEIQKNALLLTADQIVLIIEKSLGNVKMVTYSGGNPALWELGPLTASLHLRGYKVAIETQGTYYKEWIRSCDYVTVSPKGPGMGEKFEKDEFMKYVSSLTHTWDAHPTFVVKVVCFDNRDLEFAAMIREMIPSSVQLYLSVGNNILPGAEITLELHRQRLLETFSFMAEEVLQDKRLSDAILLPQLHVLAWGNKQGV